MAQNRITNEPDLKTVLDLFKKDIMISLNSHAVGTIQLFNPVKQTAQVSINYKKTFYTGPTLQDEEYVDYPVLLDVPIVIMSGGLATLTFPIFPGDTCLLLFNDRDISEWLTSGQVGPVPTQRLHSISDGFALVGVRSAIKPVLPYDPVNASLQYGLSSVKVGPAGVILSSGPVIITVPASGGSFDMQGPDGGLGMTPSGKFKMENTVTSMLEVLNGLIDVIKGLQTLTVMTSELANVTAASQATLEGYKSTIEGLLE